MDQLLKELVKVKLTKNQKDAIESFVNDRGIEIFKNSNLLKAINRHDFDAAVSEFKRWTVDSGRVKQELIDLREQEIALFTK
jgi:lysozyme